MSKGHCLPLKAILSMARLTIAEEVGGLTNSWYRHQEFQFRYVVIVFAVENN